MKVCFITLFKCWIDEHPGSGFGLFCFYLFIFSNVTGSPFLKHPSRIVPKCLFVFVLENQKEINNETKGVHFLPYVSIFSFCVPFWFLAERLLVSCFCSLIILLSLKVTQNLGVVFSRCVFFPSHLNAFPRCTVNCLSWDTIALWVSPQILVQRDYKSSVLIIDLASRVLNRHMGSVV